MKKIIVVAVHPDDETLGCGGTILKYRDKGYKVDWLICTTVEGNELYSYEYIKNRKKEIKKVREMYEFDNIYELNLKTTEVDKYSKNEIIMRISKIFNKSKPELVFLPFSNDVHSDHRIIFDCAYSCTKNFNNNFIKKIIMMETVSETDFAPSIPALSFVPNFFVEIENYIEKKIEIMNIYESELMYGNLPRSINNIYNLAKYRGSLINANFAESFMILKEID